MRQIKTEMQRTIFFTFTTYKGQEETWNRVGGGKGWEFEIPGNSEWHSEKKNKQGKMLDLNFKLQPQKSCSGTSYSGMAAF